MKWKAPIAIAVAALALPGLANAATLKGVVVAKQPARHAIVVASARGAVTTLRVDVNKMKATRIGTRLAATGTVRPDGSWQTTRLSRLGHAGKTHLRVTVVKVAGTRLLVAGGGSAFSIKLRRGARVLADAGPSLQAGDQVETEVELGGGVPSSGSLQQVGQTALIEFSGTVSALDATSIQIASNGVTTTVTLPAGITLPPVVTVGARVEVVASVSGTTLTLTALKVEDDHPDSTQATHGVEVSDSGQAKVEGIVSAVDAGSITIQPGDGAAPVVFAIPAGFDLPTVAAGNEVEARGSAVAGVLTLSKLEVDGESESGSGSASGSGNDGSQQAGDNSGSDTGGSGSGDGGSGDGGSSDAGSTGGGTGSTGGGL